MSTELSERVITWRRSPIDPELLDRLNQRSDFKGFVQAGGYLAIVLATGIASYYTWLHGMWWWFALAMILHGTVTSFAINGVHELVHGTVFKTPWLNALFVHIFAFLGWINHRIFWMSHTEHHKFTLHRPDDLEVVLPQSICVRDYLKGSFIRSPLGLWPFIREQVRLANGKFKGEWETYLLPEDAQAKRRYVSNWSRCVLFGHLTIALVSVYSGQWIIPVIVSLTPFYGHWLFTLCNNSQHIGLVDDVPDFRLCCRTIYLDPISEFLYWRMNYHIEHHMFAGVPCYNLRKLHNAIKDDLPPIPNGLLETWAQIGHILQRQRTDPDYQYRQPLPEDVDRRGDDAARADEKSGDVRRTREAADAQGRAYHRWECSICGFTYDEAIGLPEDGIAAGTRWEDIPDGWNCPDCGVAKSDFEMVDVGPSSTVSPSDSQGSPVAADGGDAASN